MARAYIRPPWFLRVIGNRVTSLTGTPVLTVAGRKSGAPQSVPVNVLEYEGERYLVAPRGETDWVRNLRAAPKATLRSGKVSEAFEVVEVHDDDKPDLIAAYRRKWDGPTKSQWEALPDPTDHPIFRMVTTKR